MMNLPPIFNWGGRIGAAPPNQRYPGWLNINRTQDVAASITKVMGRHTLKAGFYNNHSFKAQNVGAGGGLSFQGTVDFGNDTNNAIDTGFGYANAATGVFTRYQQASDFIEGQMVYDNTEFYIQDNWKLNSRTDARLRRPLHAPGAAVRQEPGRCRTSSLSCGIRRRRRRSTFRAAATARRSARATR